MLPEGGREIERDREKEREKATDVIILPEGWKERERERERAADVIMLLAPLPTPSFYIIGKVDGISNQVNINSSNSIILLFLWQ
jgi:hypothetical protein